MLKLYKEFFLMLLTKEGLDGLFELLGGMLVLFVMIVPPLSIIAVIYHYVSLLFS